MENLFSNLGKMIDQLGKEKGVDKKLIIDAVSQGLLVAARKKYGTYREIEAHYNEDSGEVELFEFKEVVEDGKLEDDQIELEFSQAQKLDASVGVGESIGINLETKSLGRIAAQAAKNIIGQKFQDAEREIIYNEFEQRKGEIASGIIRREERGTLVVDLGRTEAYMRRREQIPGEDYKPGDRIQGYIADVIQTARRLQIIISRSSPHYLIKLFKQEVPEVEDGIVEMVEAARDPGNRAKVSVRSKDQNVDPVGSCVGMKGIRVQSVIQELKGEKIDIIKWDEDPAVYVSRALSPAEVSKVFVDEEQKQMEVVVADDQLSLAIGKKGQNVRLASRLTGWRLDIVSEVQLAQRQKKALFNLMLIKGLTETMAQNLYQYGYDSFNALSETSLEQLKAVPGYSDEKKAQKLIDEAKNLVEEYKDKEVPEYQVEEKEEKPAEEEGTKEQAEVRLKEEMSKLKEKEEKKAEVKVEEKVEAKVEAKEEVKVEAKEEVKEEVKAEVKEEVKEEAKKEVKEEEKKEEDQ